MKDFNEFLEGRERKDEHSGLQQRGWSPEPSRRGLFPPSPMPSQALDLERTDAVESRRQRGAESHRLMATCILNIPTHPTTLWRVNFKRLTPRHVIVRSRNYKGERKILKAPLNEGRKDKEDHTFIYIREI